MARSTQPKSKLKHIEEDMFQAGRTCVQVFNKTRNNATLRVAVTAYRASMQAMRDQSRYKSGTTDSR